MTDDDYSMLREADKTLNIDSTKTPNKRQRSQQVVRRTLGIFGTPDMLNQ